MSEYDEWMSVYNEWMSVYDEWMSVNAVSFRCIQGYECWVCMENDGGCINLCVWEI